MTITTMAMAMTMAATVAQAAPAQEKLTVYLVDRAGITPQIRIPAESLASKMFAGIGVRLEWHGSEPVNPPSDARYVVIDLATGTPANRTPNALAYARPYEGVHITVFYDRIQNTTSESKVLAHVMVHEIAHILQGVSRHSATGVMKAFWAPHDFRDMCYKPLAFTTEDVELIHDGLAARTAGKDKAVAGDF